MLDSLKKYPEIGLYLLMVVMVTLPFWITLNSIAIILLLLYALLMYKKSNFFQDFSQKKKLFLPALLFGVNVLGLIYSDNVRSGLRVIETSLPLLGFPIIMFLLDYTESQVKKLFQVFSYCIALGAIYCLIVAIINIIQTGGLINPAKISDREYYLFLNREFTESIGLDPFYFSMYINITIAFFLCNLDLFRKNWINKTTFVILIGANLLVFSLNGLIVFIAMASFFLVRSQKLPSLRYVSVFVFLIGLTSVILFVKPFRSRLVSSLNYSYQHAHVSHWNTATLRLAVWENTLEIIADNPLIGVGTGDASDELYKKYKEKKFFLGELLKLNAHNQFFESYLMTGILGILSLSLIFIVIGLDAGKTENLFLVLLLVIFAFGFLTESALQRQKGVVCFCLCTTLLYSTNLRRQYIQQKDE